MAISRFARPKPAYTPIGNDETIRILQALDPYDAAEVLPTNWLIWRAGMNYRAGQEKLATLDGAGLIEGFIFSEVVNWSEMFKYVRTPAGERYLADRGFHAQPYNRAIAKKPHQLLSSLIQTSISMGVHADPNFSIDTVRDLLNHPRCPAETRASKYPFSFHINGQRLTPDGKPMVLRRKDPRDAKLLLREDDRHKEQITASSYATTIHEKLVKWNVVFKNKLFEAKYGISSAVLLFTTVNDRHKDNIKEEIKRTLGAPSWLLIKSIPQFARISTRIEPTTELFDTPWERVGHPPYYLSTLSPAKPNSDLPSLAEAVRAYKEKVGAV